MSTRRGAVAARCQDIRKRFAEFASGQLKPTAAGEVQGHLLSCDACSELFGEQLMEDIARGAVPLLTPPQIPPVEWYDAYMRAGSPRFGTFWKSVRDALQHQDRGLREWARTKRDEVHAGFALMTARPSTVRTRGAIHVRGTGNGLADIRKGSSPGIRAEVVSASEEATGVLVEFAVEEPPSISSDEHFRLRLSTGDRDYDDALVICTVRLREPDAISFVGMLTPNVADDRRHVHIDERPVPGPPLAIPLDRMTVAVLARPAR